MLLFFTVIQAQKPSPVIILAGKEYTAGTRLVSAGNGISFIVPRNWKGAMPPDQQVFLMSSDQHPGVGIAILQSNMDQQALINYLQQPQNLGDNVILKPLAKPVVRNSRISMSYTSMVNIGKAVALAGPDGNSVIFLFAGPVNQKTYYMSILDKLAYSVQFSGADLSYLSKAWSNALEGNKLTISGPANEQAPAKIYHFCPKGRLVTTTGINSGNSGTVEGQWRVVIQNSQVLLVLEPPGSTAEQYLPAFSGNMLLLGKEKYFLQKSELYEK